MTKRVDYRRFHEAGRKPIEPKPYLKPALKTVRKTTWHLPPTRDERLEAAEAKRKAMRDALEAMTTRSLKELFFGRVKDELEPGTFEGLRAILKGSGFDVRVPTPIPFGLTVEHKATGEKALSIGNDQIVHTDTGAVETIVRDEWRYLPDT